MRELDEQVAEQVMGWTIQCVENIPRNHWPWYKPDGEYTYRLPSYSADSCEVWDVIDRMRELGFSFHAKGWIKTKDIEVRFSDWYAANGGNGIISYAIDPYFPVAVCTAAIKAIKMMGEKE